MAEYAVAGAAPPEPDFVLRGHLAPITTCRFVETDRERLLASADTSGVAKLWSLRARRPVVSWAASDQGVIEAWEHEGGKSLLTQARDGRLRLWDLQRLGEGAAPGDALSRTLRTDSFFFTRCSVAKRSDCPFRYEEVIKAAQGGGGRGEGAPGPPPVTKARPATGIGAALDPADDAAQEREEAAQADEWAAAAAAAHWSGRPGAASHLVLAPTEPAEHMLVWDRAGKG